MRIIMRCAESAPTNSTIDSGTRMRHKPIRSYLLRSVVTSAAVVCVLAVNACGSDNPTTIASGSNTDDGQFASQPLTIRGHGDVAERFTAEVWVRGTTAYTSTWGSRGVTPGNAVKIWDVSTATPTLVDSVIVAAAGTLGDIQTSDDGSLLVVAIEPRPTGAIAIYTLANPRKPQLVSQFSPPALQNGVHTAEIARVGGKLYAFCAIDPGNLDPAKLVIVDLSTPSAPAIVSTLTIGNPYVHDVFVRDGMLFTAEWNDGVGIYDIGASKGSVAAPLLLGHARTLGGQVHNVWWYHDTNGSKRYLFAGQEGPGAIGSSSIGDIHVVDVSNFAAPVEVAIFTVPSAGVHNFSMDESKGLLYAAYYNAGVKVLNVTGNLTTCTPDQKTSNLCDLTKTNRLAAYSPAATGLGYVWGVHFQSDALYASDMLSGLWKFNTR